MYTRNDMLRDWLYLGIYALMGSIYIGLLSMGVMLGLGLFLILIGLPILWATAKAAQFMTDFDRRFMSALFEREPALLMSDRPTIWQSAVYMLGKGLMGTLIFSALSILIPVFIVELVLQRLEVDTNDITQRLTEILADGVERFNVALLPDETRLNVEEKAKRKVKNDDYTADDLDYGDEEIVYEIGDDGELVTYRRKVD